MTPLLEMRAEASRKPRPRARPTREDDANETKRTNETEIEDSRAPWTWWTSLPRVRKDFRRRVRRLATGTKRIRGGAGRWYGVHVMVFTCTTVRMNGPIESHTEGGEGGRGGDGSSTSHDRWMGSSGRGARGGDDGSGDDDAPQSQRARERAVSSRRVAFVERGRRVERVRRVRRRIESSSSRDSSAWIERRLRLI